MSLSHRKIMSEVLYESRDGIAEIAANTPDFMLSFNGAHP
jgi:hypothetical protein